MGSRFLRSLLGCRREGGGNKDKIREKKRGAKS